MKSIITWVQSAILTIVPALDLTPLPAKKHGKLRLSPVQVLDAIHAHDVAEWALRIARQVLQPRLPRGPGGRPLAYADQTILLMALVQTAWRKSYEQIVDWVATDQALALALGFSRRSGEEKLRTISQGQYWERRQALGWVPLMFFFAALLYGFRVLVVYADAAYADQRFFRVVRHLGAYPAVDYNLRRAGKRKLATQFFLRQWKRLVIRPRADIERHFAWMKRYFGLKHFQCFTFLRVSQFVLLTYLAALAVAVAACRYERPELVRSRAMVLANV